MRFRCKIVGEAWNARAQPLTERRHSGVYWGVHLLLSWPIRKC